MLFLTPARAQFGNTSYGGDNLTSNVGSYNSAFGRSALSYNTNGSNNTGLGFTSLFRNTTGGNNTGVGSQALLGSVDGNGNPNSIGNNNTAAGFSALYSLYNGNYNVANGSQALYSNTGGSYNTATGAQSLQNNTTGADNTADGAYALYSNNGNNNTASGLSALQFNSTGSNNVALGYNAGVNLTTGNNNIIIGANVLGKAGDANKIMIGKQGTQTAAYIAGITGKTVASASAVAVFIDNAGKLGTVKSSARFKDEIKPMDKASEAILKLKPVTFRYKNELDPDGVRQFGLIAEQVEKVAPDLVVRDEDGKVSTVRYEAVNAMLLNEFLKNHRKVEEQARKVEEQGRELQEQKAINAELRSTIAQQSKEVTALAQRLEKITVQLATSRATPQVAEK